MALASTGGPSIYYEVRGDADAAPLVLIRGLGRSSRHWGPLATELEASFRLILLDNRGIGQSEGARMPYGVTAMADDVARVLDDADIARAHVFGMSLGGMIAQRFAIGHRTRVDRLVLGCTSPGGPDAARPTLRTMAGLVEARLSSLEEAIAAEADLLLSPSFSRREAVLDEWIRIAKEQPVKRRVMLRQVGAALGHHAADELHRITAPTLIVSADEDDLMPPHNSRLLARRIRGAELAWVRGARHDFTTERPVEVATMLSRFLLERR